MDPDIRALLPEYTRVMARYHARAATPDETIEALGAIAERHTTLLRQQRRAGAMHAHPPSPAPMRRSSEADLAEAARRWESCKNDMFMDWGCPYIMLRGGCKLAREITAGPDRYQWYMGEENETGRSNAWPELMPTCPLLKTSLDSNVYYAWRRGEIIKVHRNALFEVPSPDDLAARGEQRLPSRSTAACFENWRGVDGRQHLW